VSQEEVGRKAPLAPVPGQLVVEEPDGRRRPFMRGIMVHSLMERGVPFEEAYRVANLIRQRLRGRPVVAKEELAKSLREMLGSVPFEEGRGFLPDRITITGHGKGLPFSKGILSQSLLAAALDPSDAFDVARQIERELVALGIREVDRRDLRRLTYQILSRSAGQQAAERYLVWRRYQEPDKPVVILLGGTSGVGKTSLAVEVAHRLGIARVLSTDSIRQVMRITLSPELVPALHASSYDAYRCLPPGPSHLDPVLAGFHAQASTVAVGIRASLDRAVAENASLILDGVSVVPGLLDLDAWADRAYVIFLVVGALDEDALRNRFAARATGQKQRAAHRYLEHFDAICKIQDHFLDLAERHDVPIVDNGSFDRSVLFVIRHVTDTLRQRGDFDVRDLL
jgi:2-phosphoglycerate kinase